jgi:hypothetical protein
MKSQTGGGRCAGSCREELFFRGLSDALKPVQLSPKGDVMTIHETVGLIINIAVNLSWMCLFFTMVMSEFKIIANDANKVNFAGVRKAFVAYVIALIAFIFYANVGPEQISASRALVILASIFTILVIGKIFLWYNANLCTHVRRHKS